MEQRISIGGMTLAYNTRSRDEVNLVLAEAESAGARVLKPAQEAFWGSYSGYFPARLISHLPIPR
ncbi:MAG: hypothetical protein WCB58_04155 [Acidobacteriaceae bacterium]|jgi:hypothetical protein